jgi:hypothetical protein
MGDSAQKVVYWHRELPPPDGEVVHDHVIEAISDRVSGAIERHPVSGRYWMNQRQRQSSKRNIAIKLIRATSLL